MSNVSDTQEFIRDTVENGYLVSQAFAAQEGEEPKLHVSLNKITIDGLIFTAADTFDRYCFTHSDIFIRRVGLMRKKVEDAIITRHDKDIETCKHERTMTTAGTAVCKYCRKNFGTSIKLNNN